MDIQQINDYLATVAAAGGNDALSASLAAGSAELTAPLISQYLYGSDDADKLTAEQKQTVSTIASLAGTAIGSTTGTVTDVAASTNAAANAVDNNHWGYHEKVKVNDISETQAKIMAGMIAAGISIPVAEACLSNLPACIELGEGIPAGEATGGASLVVGSAAAGKIAKEIIEESTQKAVDDVAKGATTVGDSISDLSKSSGGKVTPQKGLNTPSCFTAGTPITLKYSNKSIEKLSLGKKIVITSN